MISAILIATTLVAPLSPEPKAWKDVAYRSVPKGVNERRLSLDIYSPDAKGKAPVMVFLHGGGWKRGDKSYQVGGKAKVYTDAGFVYVTANYRFVPQIQFPTNAEDVASAIAWVKKNIAQHGGDPSRVFLSGHSAGAHLAAIVACDPTYLGKHQLKPTDLKGVILLDGAGYDIPKIMESGRAFSKSTYEEAFGKDTRRWELASPTVQIDKAKSVPDFLIVHAGGRADSKAQGDALAAKIRAKGAKAEVFASIGKDHAGVNQAVANPKDPQTIAMFKFLGARR